MSARPAPDDPGEWLRRARSNLLQSRRRAKGVYLEDLCFQAQQAAEKALKAVLLSRKAELPRTHNIGELLRRVDEAGCAPPDRLQQASILTDYAVMTRYPSAAEPVIEREWREAVRLAKAVVGWAAGRVRSPSRA